MHEEGTFLVSPNRVRRFFGFLEPVLSGDSMAILPGEHFRTLYFISESARIGQATKN